MPSNPYDQFDGANPYNQFDAEPSVPDRIRSILERLSFKGDERPLWRRAADVPLGLAETALTLGTGMVSSPINETIAGFAEAQPGGDTAQGVLSDPPVGTYAPKTGVGGAVVDALSLALTPVAKAVDWSADTNNPNPEVRATGHLLKAALGVAPGASLFRRGARQVPPTVADLRATAQAAYRRAESGTGAVAQNSLANVTNKIEQFLTNEGVDQTLHPSTMAGLQRLYQESTNPKVQGHSIQGIETLRKVLQAAENAAKPGSDDARLAGRVLDEFDDYIDTLDAKDMLGGVGTAPQTAKSFAEARQAWARMRRAETIESLIERAKNSSPSLTQSGYENALRLEFKSLANNPRRLGRFSKEERDAIVRVARGSVVQNLARYGGKLAIRGPISGSVSVGGGAAVAGPVGAVALPVFGEASALAARLLRLRDVKRVENLVRGGPQASRIPNSQPLDQLGYLPANALGINQGSSIQNQLKDRYLAR